MPRAAREGSGERMAYKLVIGNKNTSSWSLRPWLAMRHAGIAFEEVNINLRAADAKARVLACSPSGKVPALLVGGGRAIWDSLAIMETLAETNPTLWPRASAARAHARSVAAEMHSGFQALREHCPMHFLGRKPKTRLPKPVAANVRRIVAMWQDCRTRYGSGGPFLFGRFSAADAMYAPVASVFDGDRAITFRLGGRQGGGIGEVVNVVKVSHLDFAGDDEGCA